MDRPVSGTPDRSNDLHDLLVLALDALGAVPPSNSRDEASTYIGDALKIIGTGGNS
jgi:hypothetical protein